MNWETIHDTEGILTMISTTMKTELKSELEGLLEVLESENREIDLYRARLRKHQDFAANTMDRIASIQNLLDSYNALDRQ